MDIYKIPDLEKAKVALEGSINFTIKAKLSYEGYEESEGWFTGCSLTLEEPTGWPNEEPFSYVITGVLENRHSLFLQEILCLTSQGRAKLAKLSGLAKQRSKEALQQELCDAEAEVKRIKQQLEKL